MRCLFTIAILACVPTVFAQPELVEPPEYPATFPGPGVLHPGSPCLLLASGAIVAGDVDWVQLTLPRASLQTVIDVDFPAGTSASSLLAFRVGGNTVLNSADNNNARDNFCGFGAGTLPLGSTSDSAVDMGATPRNAVINIAITGAGDGGFTGNHTRSFSYEVWVHVIPGPCIANSDCYDGVGCTSDACTISTGACNSTPNDAACDNGDFCDGQEFCDAAAGCTDGGPPDCDDAVGCTDDTCSEQAQACVHTPNHSTCSDGLYCDGQETCHATLDCQPGVPPDCDDGVGCTIDACHEQQNACTHVPDHAACDNGSVCDGDESCSATLGCQAGAALDCDDGLFCDGQETCAAAAGCQSGSDPCAGQFCRESETRCVECESDADCDDADFCNGAETCDAAGACQPGTPPCAPDETCSAQTGECIAEETEAGDLVLDLKPGECPNLFNVRNHGRMRAALIAVGDYDLRSVDPGSLRLSRSDGKGRLLAPRDRKHGLRRAAENRSYAGAACECRQLSAQDTSAYMLEFDADELADALRLAGLRHDAQVELTLSGRLRDGTLFSASDCLRVRGADPRHRAKDGRRD